MKQEDKNYGALAMGLQLVGYIAAAVILGQILDRYVGNGSGMYTLICIVVGFVGFVVNLLQSLRKK